MNLPVIYLLAILSVDWPRTAGLGVQVRGWIEVVGIGNRSLRRDKAMERER